MTPREQKLLILILVVLAYAVADYFYRAASGFENDEGLSLQSREASAAITAMSGQLAALPLSDNGRRLLKLANTPLESDPLAAPTASMVASAAGDNPQLVLSGVISMGRTNIALIGGEEYITGDVIADTNETVKSISADAVTLVTPEGTTRTLKVLDLDPALADLTNSPAKPAL